MTPTDTTNRKPRTITLTDRPPVRIYEDEWPVIAAGESNSDDSSQQGNRPNRTWTREIRVRQHADGRALVYGVYGVYDYDTAFQGEAGAAARRGQLLIAASPNSLIDAIRAVAAELGEAEASAPISAHACDPRRWRAVAQECIADLPAEVLS